MHQNMPTVLWCHIAAFEVLGGTPREVLYDRRTTAVIGEGQPDGIVYNRVLIDLARHYGFHPRSCKLALSPDGPVGLNSQFRLKRTGIPMPSEMK
ncbi:hypothetical protein At15955_51100 (plasmid) [Agrobacterium tumefaciens]|nr:mobile element protein [Agrobacterium tumefaciens LBA4213 (Ach5)]AKC10712.1 integrase [Agrobacterium tumefaciens]AYM20095.1 hypothetical protein At15955_51100 [Agrobacterium tumefaciens]AYM71398.1 hypothetical protein AtA6_51820 [Agrobacterium tumefaciens]CUX05015.1 hypothetical protein AGR1C_pAt20073 [Agrobacterium fabacearum TT111]